MQATSSADHRKLGTKKEQAIIALLTQRSVEEAARAVGIGVRTLYRWLKETEFSAEYRAASRASFSQTTARLQQAGSAAVSTLLKIMIDVQAPPASRVRAAHSVLQHALHALELQDLEARITDLEQETKEKG